MPAPGVSEEEAKRIKKAKAEKDEAAAKKAKKKAEYLKKANPETVEALIDPGALEKDFFKEGEWKPSWGIVEFVGGWLC